MDQVPLFRSTSDVGQPYINLNSIQIIDWKIPFTNAAITVITSACSSDSLPATKYDHWPLEILRGWFSDELVPIRFTIGKTSHVLIRVHKFLQKLVANFASTLSCPTLRYFGWHVSPAYEENDWDHVHCLPIAKIQKILSVSQNVKFVSFVADPSSDIDGIISSGIAVNELYFNPGRCNAPEIKSLYKLWCYKPSVRLHLNLRIIGSLERIAEQFVIGFIASRVHGIHSFWHNKFKRGVNSGFSWKF